MTQPAVLSTKPLPNRLTEVVLSRHGVRFTITLATDLVGTPVADAMYLAAADRMESEHARVSAIVAPGRQLVD